MAITQSACGNECKFKLSLSNSLTLTRFLRERIHLTRATKKTIQAEMDSTLAQIQSTFNEADRTRITQHIDHCCRREFDKCKARQLTKLQDLAEQSLNFTVTPHRVPAMEIVATVETALQKLDPETADLFRSEVNATLWRARPPRSNINQEQRITLKALQEDRSIVIHPTYKGRGSVILDADTYRDKMSELISMGPYQKLAKDPTDQLCRKITAQLLALNKTRGLDDTTDRKLCPISKQPPRMYGLPKIHKPGTPLRPIVSCVSSFAYNRSKHLAGIVSPLTGNTPNTMPNSTAFAEFLRGRHIDSHEALICFNIKSLFTKIPIGNACCVALRRLEEDPELPDWTSISQTKTVSLLEFVLRSTYFLYSGA
ncbi:uncharacterized protein LOC110982311 [Acanthaster planci]|uniref:Uncharacterized protein LOC110982311 n=1 Tax=Acanthaster planci TaxID=133434 RepID=A0A8B7YYL8_ACAPL|nr:uncharacterized protein LOC110982311 [Acanthaster planci]